MDKHVIFLNIPARGLFHLSIFFIFIHNFVFQDPHLQAILDGTAHDTSEKASPGSRSFDTCLCGSSSLNSCRCSERLGSTDACSASSSLYSDTKLDDSQSEVNKDKSNASSKFNSPSCGSKGKSSYKGKSRKSELQSKSLTVDDSTEAKDNLNLPDFTASTDKFNEYGHPLWTCELTF